MHRSIRYYPKICSIYSFGVVGASYSKYLGRVVVQKSVCNVRSHSTEPESELSADYGSYSIILPPENAPVGIAHHKARSVPDEITRPRYTRSNRSPIIKGENSVESRRKGKSGRLILGTDEEQRMRRACKLAKDTLEFAASLIKVRNFHFIMVPLLFYGHCLTRSAGRSNDWWYRCGSASFRHFKRGLSISTEISRVSEFNMYQRMLDFRFSGGSILLPLDDQAFLFGYMKWNLNLHRIQVNNIVAHGIPDEYVWVAQLFACELTVHYHSRSFQRIIFLINAEQCLSRPLENGDIMNIDVTVFLDGYHGDTSRTFAVGSVVCFIARNHYFDHSGRPSCKVYWPLLDRMGREATYWEQRSKHWGWESVLVAQEDHLEPLEMRFIHSYTDFLQSTTQLPETLDKSGHSATMLSIQSAPSLLGMV
jgi:Metallopeptidase family M24